MNRLAQTKDRKGERGSILAMSAIGMLSLLLAVGLGVDITHLYLAKNELQNAADASALAGASGLNFHAEGIYDATKRATEELNNYNKYEFNNQQVNVTADNVRFASNLNDFDNGPGLNQAAAAAPGVVSTIRFVKVITPESPVPMSFVGFLLGSSRNLTAKAVAGVSAPLNLFMGYLPLFLIDDNSLSTFTPGNVYTIRSAPQNSISPGNYQILAIDGAGGADDRIDLASAVQNVVGPGGYVDTKPGVTAGAIRQGINTRFDDYASGMDPADFPPDTNIKEGITYDQYLSGSPTQSPSHEGVDGRRVVLLPIMKISELDGGRTTVQIDHFGAFFLRSKVSGGNGLDIQAEYIGTSVVVGNGVYDPFAPPNPGPPIVKPVLYQ
jgi:Flp pilus assembly protein TadG